MRFFEVIGIYTNQVIGVCREGWISEELGDNSNLIFGEITKEDYDDYQYNQWVEPRSTKKFYVEYTLKECYICPICDSAMDDVPDDYNICPTCWTEFGYEWDSERDDAEERLKVLRAEWLNKDSHLYKKAQEHRQNMIGHERELIVEKINRLAERV